MFEKTLMAALQYVSCFFDMNCSPVDLDPGLADAAPRVRVAAATVGAAAVHATNPGMLHLGMRKHPKMVGDP